VLFEGSLRLFNYGIDLQVFQKSKLYPDYYEINKDVGMRYFRRFEATSPTKDIFLVDKPDTCYRIFVLGCSTTRGFPYQTGTMFSRILNYRLQDVFPHKRIEVVNLSMSAINSFSVADMMDEVLDNKPDAIIIYTGHNEYYGALGVGSIENGGNFIWLKKLQLKLVRFRTFQLIQKTVFWISSKLGNEGGRPRGSLMERIVQKKSILFGSAVYNDGIIQFESNISEVLKKAKNRNVPVILSEIICNVKDQQPFKSQSSDTIPGALEVFKNARESESQGKFELAKVQYYKAKDLDVIRFRAPEDFNTVLLKLGEQYKTPVVPMRKIFEEKSPNGLIGFNLILEHLHPNINGYFLMADAFFQTLRKNNYISGNWDTTLIKPSEFYRHNWGFTELDSLIGDLKIKMLKAGWPFKPETEINMFTTTYKPKNFIDSIAFSYVSNDSLHIEDQHVYLANIFYDMGEYNKAFNEYKSLIMCYPYVSELYFGATKYLIAEKKYSDAIELINTAPDIEKDYDYYYMLGTLNMDLLRYQESINYFNSGRKLADSKEKEIKILRHLYTVYKSVNDSTNAENIYKSLKSINPDFDKKQETESVDDSKIQSLTILAIEQIKLKQPEKALSILLSANEIKETVLVNKMIGSIFYMLKDERAYDYYQKAFLSSPNDPEILNNLILLSLMRNDVGQAQYYLDKLKYVSFDYKKIKNMEGLLEKKAQELKKK
jgi:tetratricopeptide (TPR) repeat protein